MSFHILWRRQICVSMFDVNINVILGREMRSVVCRVIYFCVDFHDVYGFTSEKRGQP